MAEKATNKLIDFYNQPQVKISANLILSVLATLFFVSFAIRPTLTTIASLKKQIKDQQQVLTLMQQKIDTLNQAEQVYYQNQPYFTYLDKALPEEPNITRFASQINYLAQAHGITLTSFSFNAYDVVNNIPVDKKTPAEKTAISFHIELEGPWDSTKEFVSSLEAIDRINRVYDVSQTLAKTENLIDTSLKGEVYYFANKGYL